MSNLSRSQKLHLDQLVNDDFEDNTDHLREVKPSVKIEHDIRSFIAIKKKYPSIKPSTLEAMCIKRCGFLHSNYTDIFNRLIRDELDMVMFNKFISVLRNIEDGVEDQHSGSVIIGTLLKEIYIDSAMKRGKKNTSKHNRINKKKKAVEHSKTKALKTKNPEKYMKKTMSWGDYKTSLVDT